MAFSIRAPPAKAERPASAARHRPLAYRPSCRCRDAEDEADLVERNAVAQHLGRRVCRRACAPLTGVTMSARFMMRFTTRRDAVASSGMAGTVRSCAGTRDRSAQARSAFEVGSDRIPDLLRQRQPDLVARLAADPQRARLPLDIGETQLRHVTGPQPEARQQAARSHDHAGAHRRRRHRQHQPVDLLGSTDTAACRKLPMA